MNDKTNEKVERRKEELVWMIDTMMIEESNI
jgi:hypothetical protein